MTVATSQAWVFGWDQLIALLEVATITLAAILAYSGINRILSQKRAELKFQTAHETLKQAYRLNGIFHSLSGEDFRNLLKAFEINYDIYGYEKVELQKVEHYNKAYKNFEKEINDIRSSISELDINLGRKPAFYFGIMLNSFDRIAGSAYLIEEYLKIACARSEYSKDINFKSGMKIGSNLITENTIKNLWQVLIPSREDPALIKSQFNSGFRAFKLECEIASGKHRLSAPIRRFIVHRKSRIKLSKEQLEWRIESENIALE